MISLVISARSFKRFLRPFLPGGSPHSERPAVFLYDAIPGGVGLADKLFEVRDDLLDACLALASACDCEIGCPGCVGPQVETNSPAKKAARLMLERAIG